MKKEELNEILRKHELWLEDAEGGENADLWDANLQNADLLNADLRDANLQHANLDYSCLPLWCGGSRFTCDMRLIYQLLAHVCSLKCDDPEFVEIREKILPYAKKSHRAADLGLLDKED